MLLAVLHRHLGRCVDVKKKKRERMNPQKKLYEQLGLEPLKPRCVAYIGGCSLQMGLQDWVG